MHPSDVDRAKLKTSDDEIRGEFDRVSRMFQLALGRPSDRALFDHLMNEASGKGLNWVEGLQYVIPARRQQEAMDGDETAPSET